jgi:hypothetical protein
MRASREARGVGRRPERSVAVLAHGGAKGVRQSGLARELRRGCRFIAGAHVGVQNASRRSDPRRISCGIGGLPQRACATAEEGPARWARLHATQPARLPRPRRRLGARVSS